MYYVCIENNEVSGIFNYEPAVPSTVTVVEISNEDYSKLESEKFYFNVKTRTIEAKDPKRIPDHIKAMESYRFLNSTDWMVLRHIREIALGEETTLSNEEYIELERKRNDAAKSV